MSPERLTVTEHLLKAFELKSQSGVAKLMESQCHSNDELFFFLSFSHHRCTNIQVNCIHFVWTTYEQQRLNGLKQFHSLVQPLILWKFYFKSHARNWVFHLAQSLRNIYHNLSDFQFANMHIAHGSILNSGMCFACFKVHSHIHIFGVGI